jgi:hypothetical protein
MPVVDDILQAPSHARKAASVGLAIPVAALLITWVWSYAAWHSPPDARFGTQSEQEAKVFWASDLPLIVGWGLTVISSVASASYLAWRRHLSLAVAVVLYAVPFLIGELLLSLAYINFKPPGW